MTLRTRLLVAQAPVGLALVLVGIVSVSAIASLGSRPELILRDNYRSVLAGERMLDAEKDLGDLALRYALDRPVDERQRTAAVERFDRELAAQEANITERGEAEATRDLRDGWGAFQRALDQIVAAPRPERLERWEARFVPADAALQRSVRTILAINQDAMHRKSELAQRSASRTTLLVVLVSLGAVAAGVLASFWLMARTLRPLGVLSQTVRRIGEGDLDVRAPVAGGDEIAALGREFNTMAERLRQYRSSSLGELLQAQQASQAAIDSLPDPVLVLDATGTILNSNGAADALFPRSAGAQPSIQALAPDLRASVERARAHVLAGRGPWLPHGFDEAVRVDGSEGARRLLPRAAPLYSEAGAITGATLVLQDVTRLMRFDELKNDLVATVAHEFRTPLTSLRMAIHLCAGEAVGPLTEKQADLMHAARQDCERLQAIVDDLLDLSRIQAGRLELSRSAVTPRELVDGALTQHRDDAASARVSLSAVVGEQVPLVAVDRDRIALVLSNLVANAIRYTPPGGAVILSAVRGDRCVRFEVRDTGAGIAPEFQDRVFEKFFRGPGAPTGGVGLGLYLAREIVEAHGGRIGLESAPGEGSRFWFTVPEAACEPGIAPPGATAASA